MLQAVSPPNTMQVSSFPAPMPTAAAVAAAAVTAKITAMDAIVPVSAFSAPNWNAYCWQPTKVCELQISIAGKSGNKTLVLEILVKSYKIVSSGTGIVQWKAVSWSSK